MSVISASDFLSGLTQDPCPQSQNFTHHPDSWSNLYSIPPRHSTPPPSSQQLNSCALFAW
ncbi:hypothetical protein PtA15_8A601 [Puccinia triticina]|uniref:Uncharacterized protein n=1 Tax=Puccinia triticina TaxID=208348 RepID=A0ABY7CV80_9BASI|nr:uncharacterized protein PtA15_8A601 [Puccinia triticina]WAQ87695.1 hypothetical protein PtA15_8A601 [Puccinia triticina]